ncbi:hypothetical protein A6E01_18935 (plasmid) [Vibrio breoganii]|uniref:Flagellar basal-body rod protein FlgF n=2 Tax=Vibrio TaxID=662 RepID=A0AAN0XZ05_9VIBR|nr:flagellar basal body rod protein FlgF [Vibrio breoganii]ANO35291.1 hypothetical protein A6E01_18935 [Vibrio breoganii]PML12787.1 hypothetical protein BCT84_02565 [Vibrio breoganii]
MDPIFYNVVSGAERTMYAQHARANNIANASTVGFRALMEFTTPQTIEGDGFEGSATTRTNLAMNSFAVGAMMKTDNPLNVALDNQGFIAVQGLEGEPEELYTRAGDMVLNDEGEVTIGGRSVLTEDGPLVLPLYQSIQVSNDGVVSVVAPGDADGQEVAALKLVNPTNSEVTLDRSGLFRSLTGEPLDAADDVTMRSGFLEGSNVSVIEELTGMLKLSRQFEVNVKMMVAAQDIGRAGNEVMQA